MAAVTLRFDFEPEKFIQVAAYLTAQCPAMTKMKLFKLLFFADMTHVATYGRPICGGHYVAMANGPVHSEGYDMMKSVRSALHSHLQIQGRDIRLQGADPGLDALSDSDVEVLDGVITQYRDHLAEELSELSHAVAAWQNTPRNSDIPFEHFLNDADLQLRQIVLHDQELRDFVADISLLDEPILT